MKKIVWVILITSFFATSCMITKTVDEDVYPCPVESLLVEAEAFRILDVEGPFDLPGKVDASESISRSYFFLDAATWQVVAPFSTNEEAHEEYSTFTKDLFVVDEYSGGWETPTRKFQSTVVDEFVYECGYQNDERVCIFSSRYENYQAIFLMRMGTSRFDDNDFISALRDIDKRMESCFSSTDDE